jgi:hypothetical protein
MRCLAAFLLGLLVVGPAWAQTNSTSGHVFGSSDCPMPVICPGEIGATSSSEILADANMCINQIFGYSSDDGFFTEGLDSNNCLTAIPNVLPKGVGARLAPQCCLTQLSNGKCVVHCSLVSP